MPDKEKRLEPPDDRPNLLFLPIINGKGYTRAEVELLQEMGVEVKVFPDGTYTINGETPEEIRAKHKKSMEELTKGKPKDETANGKILHLRRQK